MSAPSLCASVAFGTYSRNLASRHIRRVNVQRRAIATACLAFAIFSAPALAFAEPGEVVQRRLDDGEGVAVSYAVYLPSEARNPGVRLPVAYMLHGFGASHCEWLGALALAETLDALIEAGEIAPLIAVMPDAGKSWYVDSAVYGGPGDFETAIAVRLIAAVDREFPTLPSRDSRAISGLSMGGYGALRLAFKYPDRFGAVAALSPGLFRPGGISWQHGPGGRRWASRKLWYGQSFGRSFDSAIYDRASPFSYLEAMVRFPDPPQVLLVAGDDDEMGAYDGTVEMFLDLRRLGLKPELRIAEGKHNHCFWRSMLRETLIFIGRSLDHTKRRS